MKLQGIPIHPAANLFPEMDRESFEKLKEDIRTTGQLEEVTVFQGQLIDGRHRAKACEELGIEVNAGEMPNEWHDGTPFDPYQFVISTNLHRRHLTESQRSMVAAKMANMKEGRPTKKTSSIDNVSTINDAANVLNIGKASVCRAKTVLNKGSDSLVKAVESGDVPVSLAERLVKECDDKKTQTELAKQGKKAIREFLTPPPDVVEDEDEIEEETEEFEEAEPQETGVLHEARKLFERCNDDQRTLILNLWSEWIEAKPTASDGVFARRGI